MSEHSGRTVDHALMDRLAAKRGGLPPSGGGGTSGDMEQRVAALEGDMKEIKAVLKELRDGQQAAALRAVEQAGELNAKLFEIKSGFSGVEIKFAEASGKLDSLKNQFEGKLSNLQTQSDGLRRDIEKLPTEYGVAKIMVFVIGGLGAAAVLIKNLWPLLSKLFGP